MSLIRLSNSNTIYTFEIVFYAEIAKNLKYQHSSNIKFQNCCSNLQFYWGRFVCADFILPLCFEHFISICCNICLSVICTFTLWPCLRQIFFLFFVKDKTFENIRHKLGVNIYVFTSSDLLQSINWNDVTHF